MSHYFYVDRLLLNAELLFGVQQGSLKDIENGTIRKLLGTVSYSHSITTIAVSWSRFGTIHERDRHPARHRTTARAALCSRAKLRGKNLM